MTVVNSLHPTPGLKVLVTAGASGIGAAIARAFCDAGAQVHICDIDRDALERIEQEAPNISTSKADASSEKDVKLVFDDVMCTLGGLDVLVNNAGIAGPTGPIQDINCSDWQRTIEVNLNSQYLFAHYAVPLLMQSKSDPCMIAMSSVGGRVGYPYRTPYAASKWGIVGMTKSLAIELGSFGIRVNAILPGAVEGERIDRVITSRALATGVSIDEMHREHIKKISLGRFISPNDIAAMTLFLASPGARNVSGQAISVDGNTEYL